MNATRGQTADALVVRALTPSRWRDLERLFGPRGACAGCWCMYWCLPHAQYEQQKGERNKRALQGRVAAGDVPGVLGYLGGEPIAWCAIEPRQRYPRLARSRILEAVDDREVWSITCLYVRRDQRRHGHTVALLRGAADHARKRGATLVEGYPQDPGSERMAAAFAWTGLASAFRAAGFREVARRSPKRPIMRLELERRAQ